MCSAFPAYVAVEEPGKQNPVRYNYSVLTGRLGTERRDRYHRIAHGPGGGESRFDYGVDEAQPLVEAGERAFHRVDRQPFDIGPAVAELLGQPVEFRAERDLAHEPVVGIHRDPELQLAEQADRVLRDR